MSTSTEIDRVIKGFFTVLMFLYTITQACISKPHEVGWGTSITTRGHKNKFNDSEDAVAYQTSKPCNSVTWYLYSQNYRYFLIVWEMSGILKISECYLMQTQTVWPFAEKFLYSCIFAPTVHTKYMNYESNPSTVKFQKKSFKSQFLDQNWMVKFADSCKTKNISWHEKKGLPPRPSQ